MSKLSEIWSGMFIPESRSWFFTHPGSKGQKGTGSRIRIRSGAALYYSTLCTDNHWNSIPPLSIVQPAEELGLIDGIDQVEAYIQRNYGDQARLNMYCCLDKRFFSHTASSTRNIWWRNLSNLFPEDDNNVTY